MARTPLWTFVGAATLVRRDARRAARDQQAASLAVAALFAVWGLIWGLVPLSLQTLMLTATPDSPEASSAMFITVSQAAIAVGSAIGGVLVDSAGLASVFVVAGLTAIVAGLFAGIAQARPCPVGDPVACAAGPWPGNSP